MAQFIIQGGFPLKGEVKVNGSKNTSLKILAATILTDQTCLLTNIPQISDIAVMLEIIRRLGGKVVIKDHSLIINNSSLNSASPPEDLVKKMRASIVVVGPLLARFKEIRISQPGGDLIGARPIDTHIDAFRQLNVQVEQEDGFFLFRADRARANKVILREMSVTATENIMMFAATLKGETEIRVAAAEPEIEDLARCLNKMGAKISGAGTHVIQIKGVSRLSGVEHQVIPDRIEAGTFIIAALASRGKVRVTHLIPQHLDAVIYKLKEANAQLVIESDAVLVKPTTSLRPVYIDTRPYPGFPTDLQAPMAVLLTQASGTSRIFETLFESRFNYTKELAKMGADITILNPHTIDIHGPTPLYGKEILSYDLRAGASLVIAALIAKGESIIDHVELIDRGYEKFDERLKALGAKIERKQ